FVVQGSCGKDALAIGLLRLKTQFASEEADRLRQRVKPVNRHPIDDGRFSGIVRRQQQFIVPAAGQTDRQGSGDRLDLTVPRQFAHEHAMCETVGSDDLFGEQNPDTDHQSTAPARRLPIAIARASPAPSFLTSAGARFTVIFFAGKWKPVFLRAERTRSRLARTVASGRPTTENCGRPPAMSTSTSIRCASSPTSATLLTLASMNIPFCSSRWRIIERRCGVIQEKRLQT